VGNPREPKGDIFAHPKNNNDNDNNNNNNNTSLLNKLFKNDKLVSSTAAVAL
jgi:hypothetical protein